MQTYTIGRGNNLGQQGNFLGKQEATSDYTYKGTMQEVYSDTEILWETSLS